MSRNTVAPRKTRLRQNERLDMGLSGNSTISDEWMLEVIREAIVAALTINQAAVADVNAEARRRAVQALDKGKQGRSKPGDRGR
jgi:hypothetical protein